MRPLALVDLYLIRLPIVRVRAVRAQSPSGAYELRHARAVPNGLL